jgi:hypothetical protein
MKTIELARSAPSLQEILAIARKETLLLRTEAGEEFFLGTADELRTEATLLSQNPEFMRFLDERFAEEATIPLEQLESEATE